MVTGTILQGNGSVPGAILRMRIGSMKISHGARGGTEFTEQEKKAKLRVTSKQPAFNLDSSLCALCEPRASARVICR